MDQSEPQEEPDYFYTSQENIPSAIKKKRVLFSPTADVLDVSIDTPENKGAQEVINISSSSESEFTDVSERTRSKFKSKFVPTYKPPSRFFVSLTTVGEETVYITDSSDTSEGSTSIPGEAEEETPIQSQTTLTEEILQPATLAWASYSIWNWQPTDNEVQEANNSLKKALPNTPRRHRK